MKITITKDKRVNIEMKDQLMEAIILLELHDGTKFDKKLHHLLKSI